MRMTKGAAKLQRLRDIRTEFLCENNTSRNAAPRIAHLRPHQKLDH